MSRPLADFPVHSVTTVLENLEMSENFAVVREMSGNWPFVTGMLL